MAMSSASDVKATVKQMQDKDSSMEKDIKEIKDMLSKTNNPTWPTLANKSGESGAERGLRELQVIAIGLKESIDEDDVIKQVKSVVDGLGVGSKYTDIFTFKDLSSIGIVEFKSLASKIGFLKKANTMQTKWTNGDHMHFKCNDDLVDRVVVSKGCGFGFEPNT